MLVNIKGEKVGHDTTILHNLCSCQTVVDNETGLPTDKLSDVAITECRLAGSVATTVSEITQGEDDDVLKMIKKGIDEANKHAVSRTHKVCTDELPIVRDTYFTQQVTKWKILNTDFSVAGGELSEFLF